MTELHAPAGLAGNFDDDRTFAEATILVVDDNPTNIEVLVRMLRSAGAERIHTTTDPRQALPLAVSVQPDVVLLDLHMPGLDGVTVMRAINETLDRDTFLPILVLTADTTGEARNGALESGAADFLTKPLDRVEVILRVRNMLRTRSLHQRVIRHRSALEQKVRDHQRHEEQQERDRLERDARLRRALEPGSIQMLFQPIVRLATRETVGFESLARFTCAPQRGPDIWFNEAAEAGMGLELELAAIRDALPALETLPQDSYLSLNLSPQLAMQADVIDEITSGRPDRIVLEITEHARVDDYPALAAALAPARSRGARLAVDDAGAGFASFQHILTLHPDIIKLDITLTRDIDHDPVRRSLATALVSFACELDATIVAEGIETSEELDALDTLGITCGQGYHLGRPAPPPMPHTLA